VSSSRARHSSTCLCVYACVYVCVYVCMCMYVFIVDACSAARNYGSLLYVYVCVCVCVYTYVCVHNGCVLSYKALLAGFSSRVRICVRTYVFVCM